ncbi:host attachment protein [Ostreiculturibacter nitratireducens]|uniref:host attachment protein n=1 Tax=Ostreiculturibacter nitratireducens TaxID=3075226 RepID=UPI0031B58C97
MKPVRTLIVVADEEAARFLINEGVGKGLQEICVVSISQLDEGTLEFADRPGRSSAGSKVVGRHGMDPRTDLEENNRAKFASHVIEALDQEWKAAKADRLVVAAPPKMLGELRSRLSGAPAAALAGDLAKDLVNVPLNDLPGHFADILAV